MNATTSTSAAEFIVAYPALLRRYQDLVQLCSAWEERWLRADTARFDARVRKAQQQFDEAQASAQNTYARAVHFEQELLRIARADASAELNSQLAEFLRWLDEQEAPLFEARRTEIAYLTAERQACERTARELGLPSAPAPVNYEAEIAAANERCEEARKPLREQYGAKVEQAYAAYNAVLAATSTRYAEHEGPADLDRKRSLRLAERIKHDTLRQIAWERDEAADTRREWSNARQRARLDALNNFLLNPHQQELVFERFLLDEIEQLRKQLSEESPA